MTDVKVDGELVWPRADSPFPPSVIRTRGGLRRLTGSRRSSGRVDTPGPTSRRSTPNSGLDALDDITPPGWRRSRSTTGRVLILLSDQLYADELTPESRRRLAGRRSRMNRHGQRPPDEVVSFAECQRLYRHSWGDPEIGWLMSTVPTAMIFVDATSRDDWNTSASWRADMKDKPWWRDGSRAGLASYWVYQHLGNLSPAELADDEDYQRLVATDGDTWRRLVDLADRADQEVDCNKGIQIQLSMGSAAAG